MSTEEFTPIYSVSLVEQITGHLTNSIMEGKLKGGERLVENELQGRFGTSRGPIREAFRILEQNGFLVSIPRKGTYVRKVTKKDVLENFPIRAALESLAARLAIQNQTSQGIEEMQAALTCMETAAGEKDNKSYSSNHYNFHKVLIQTCGNDKLIEFITNLRRQAVWFWFSVLYVRESFDYAIRVHRDILELFIKKDPDAIEARVSEHILYARDNYIRYLSSMDNGEPENDPALGNGPNVMSPQHIRLLRKRGANGYHL